MAAVTTGVLGGAFDPPHLGHVALARAGSARFGLGRLLVRVVAEPGHKDVATPPGVRLALAGLAFASLAGAEVALDPFARTVESLEALDLDNPVFLVGADEFADFLTLEGAEPGPLARAARSRDAPGCRSGGARRRPGPARPARPGDALRPRAARRLVDGDPQTRRRRRVDRRARPRGRRARDPPSRPLRGRGSTRGRGYAWLEPERTDVTDLNSLEHARRIAALCEEKLATDVAILDMRSVCDYTDYFVIATGQNTRQTKAIVDEVHAALKRDAKVTPRSTSGLPEASWILADYLDVVLHVFTPETRAYYRLEELWDDVPKLEAAATA